MAGARTPAPSLLLYVAVALVAGAVIALQLSVMRVFAVGSWTHFGSFVVSLAMLGFGLASAVMSLSSDWFVRRWRGVSATALIAMGPLMVSCHLIAQQVPFNPIFIVSDPAQKWNLLANFLLYFLPFLAGAMFIGTVFLKSTLIFGRVYFADLVGAGGAGILILLAMFVFPPADLISVPLLLWFAGGLAWLSWTASRRGLVWLVIAAVFSAIVHFALPGWLGIPSLSVSDYKGIAYAQKFPDATVVHDDVSPFGDLSIYSSSYLHFAPGLSDNAAFNIERMPDNAYLGLYIDGDGPGGIMRELPPEQTVYFRFLPHYYPYLLKEEPETFVVQFGGGISTAVALRSGAPAVTVAEANPAVLSAFRADAIRDFTGDLIDDPRLTIIPYEGRLFLASTEERFDIIDLSLADSVGLSSPGGFAVVEKYAYTVEAMRTYMGALADGGILSVTVWNKEDPPKSVLRLYATMAEAARQVDPDGVADSFFVSANYLSTATVLYKRGGFTPEEIAVLSDHTYALSFDEIYSPGFVVENADPTVLDQYREMIFGTGEADPVLAAPAGDPLLGVPDDPLLDPLLDFGAPGPAVLPATMVGRLAWQALVADEWDGFSERYVFDVEPLTNNRPYFAAYVRPGDLPKTLDRLELFQDDWGYLAVWATLAVAGVTALALLFLPLIFGWRTIFSRYPGKFGVLLYFACLGIGYMLVEVGMIAKFVLALANPTISAAVLITGMLIFSGLGSLVSERFLDRSRRVMPPIFVAIGVILIGYGLLLDPVLDAIGALPYVARLVLCILIIAPPAFLMGFPLPTAMAQLGLLRKESLFIWAWGVNGSFSVIGSAAIPVLATSFGLGAVLQFAGGAYLLALPAFFAVLLPLAPKLVRAPA
ncbi:MAG: hypothetical protein KIS96_03045 [Bauldia sp.]|nr:hypothetical protein [Bauldia sp.]